MSANSQRTKFQCFCRFNLQVQAQIILLNQSAEGAAFKSLCPCSEPLRQGPFHDIQPWLVSLNFFPPSDLDYFLFSFHLLVISFFLSFFVHFPGHLTPGANYFYFLFFSVNNFQSILPVHQKKINIYLSAQKIALVYSKKRYQRN